MPEADAESTCKFPELDEPMRGCTEHPSSDIQREHITTYFCTYILRKASQESEQWLADQTGPDSHHG